MPSVADRFLYYIPIPIRAKQHAISGGRPRATRQLGSGLPKTRHKQTICLWIDFRENWIDYICFIYIYIYSRRSKVYCALYRRRLHNLWIVKLCDEEVDAKLHRRESRGNPRSRKCPVLSVFICVYIYVWSSSVLYKCVCVCGSCESRRHNDALHFAFQAIYYCRRMWAVETLGIYKSVCQMYIPMYSFFVANPLKHRKAALLQCGADLPATEAIVCADQVAEYCINTSPCRDAYINHKTE